jgi:hypothetical protein
MAGTATVAHVQEDARRERAVSLVTDLDYSTLGVHVEGAQLPLSVESDDSIR